MKKILILAVAFATTLLTFNSCKDDDDDKVKSQDEIYTEALTAPNDVQHQWCIKTVKLDGMTDFTDVPGISNSSYDILEFNEDGTFSYASSLVTNNVAYKGTFTVKDGVVTCKSEDGKLEMSAKISSLSSEGNGNCTLSDIKFTKSPANDVTYLNNASITMTHNPKA